jgi:hypothetical protein
MRRARLIRNRSSEALESDERRWDAAFAAAPDKLRRLARKTLDEFHSGQTEALDPEKL